MNTATKLPTNCTFVSHIGSVITFTHPDSEYPIEAYCPDEDRITEECTRALEIELNDQAFDESYEDMYDDFHKF